MRIAKVRLRNWKCFRGEHEKAFGRGEGVYAITARTDGDAARSNWCGKSTFLQAIRFALHGEHGARLEDDWISLGEGSGEVSLTFDTGATVLRSRARGKSTQLAFWNGDADKAIQADAQTRIDQAVGLSGADFANVCFFGQKALDARLKDDPAERMRTFAAWFDLSPLRKAAERDQSELRELTKEIRRLEIQAEACAKAVEGVDPVRLRDQIERAREKATAVRRAREERHKREADERDAARFHAVDAEGRALATKALQPEALAKLGDKVRAAQRAKEDAALAAREAQVATRRASELARGEFDGQCPVARKACPSAAWVAEMGKGHASECKRATAALDAAEKALAKCWEKAQALQNEERDATRAADRLFVLRNQALDLLPAVERLEEAPTLAPEPGDDPEALERFAASLEATADRAAQAATDLLATEEALARANARAIVLSESAVVFGAHGAQKMVAEGELREIEDRTNVALAGLGSGLSLAVSWGRPVKGQLAPFCDACGASNGTSKAKTCASCGAPRGQKVDERVDLVPSHVSGGAEDLCGLTFGLASWSWLRRERSSAWGVVFFDEPFGALDAHHKRALSVQLPQLLASVGVEQAFVVAHEAALVDSMPQRIQIVSDGVWSRFE